MSIESATAVVTGTSGGIGAAIAARMLDDGYRVVGISRRPSPLEGRPGFGSELCDLADEAACEALVPRLLESHERIDVLVNNAAAIAHLPSMDTSPAQLQSILDVNLTAPFVLSRDVARAWVAGGTSGCIVNICSIESDVAWPDPPQVAYATSKGGLVGLTRALALDLAPYGIRVNGVAPGVIATEFTPPESAAVASIPQGRLGTTSEIASAVAFVASEEASYMTGEILYVDGGYRIP